MLSTPTASPTSICPARISLAIVVTATRPEEQKRFIVWMGTLSGIPAANADDRASYVGPFERTVPTQMSSIISGLIPLCLIACYEMCEFPVPHTLDNTHSKHLSQKLITPMRRKWGYTACTRIFKKTTNRISRNPPFLALHSGERMAIVMTTSSAFLD
jgi:hypothetical protein